MSYVISTDVFCDHHGADGNRCGAWIHGATGSRIKAQQAFANAKHHGWTRLKGNRHLCPRHSKEQKAGA